MSGGRKKLSINMNDDNEFKSESEEDSPESFVNPEMDHVFNKSYYLDSEEAITLKKNYILHIGAETSSSEPKLCLGLSSYEACVYSVGASLRCSSSLPAETSPIINVRFAPDNPSLVYIGCSKGLIRLWDLRNTNKSVQQFKDTSNPKENNLHEKNLCSFDVNSNGRFLCAGTEVTDGDAFLMFWDTRQATLLGGYWESHTDDVTQVVFDPVAPDRLITGSTDGLINVYDITHKDESEALQQSLNTESSVEKLCWHGETLSCVTHTADVQLWRPDDSGPYASFTRPDIASTLQMAGGQLQDSLYVTDVHSTSLPGQLMVLAGSNAGSGRCLRSALATGTTLGPSSHFEGNKQIVRCSWFSPQSGLLVTGGEAGILSVWRPGSNHTTTTSTSHLKVSSKLKEKPHKSKKKPY